MLAAGIMKILQGPAEFAELCHAPRCTVGLEKNILHRRVCGCILYGSDNIAQSECVDVKPRLQLAQGTHEIVLRNLFLKRYF